MKTKTTGVIVPAALLCGLLLTPFASADSLNAWTVQNGGLVFLESDVTGGFNAVTYANGLFVAVGSIIATSTNGVNWTVADRNTQNYASNPLTSVVYGNGTFVAVGSGVAVTSTDGIHWNNYQTWWTYDVQDDLPNACGIAFGAGLFVVYAPANFSGSAISISQDGQHWTPAPEQNSNFYVPTESQDLIGLAYNNTSYNGSQFVTIAQYGYVETVTAANLLQLLQNPNETLPQNFWLGFQTMTDYGGPNSGFPNGFGSLTCAPNDYYYLGGGADTFGASISSGQDTYGNPLLVGDLMPNVNIEGGPYPAIAYGNNELVASTGDWILSASANVPLPGQPVSWSARWNLPNYPQQQINGLVYGNGLWVAVGSAQNGEFPLVLTSGSLITLASSASPIGGSLLAVASGPCLKCLDGYQYVAAGDSGAILTSTNGIVWAVSTSPTTNRLRGLASTSAGSYIAVGDAGAILTSVNSATWTTLAPPIANDLYGVAIGDGLDVAVGASGAVLTSTNGVNWTSQPLPTTNNLTGIAFGDGQFEALSSDGSILISTNAVNWTTNFPSLSGASSQLISISYGGGQFTALDASGDVLISTAGMNWSPLLTGVASGGPALNSVSFVDGDMVLVGDSGTILTVKFAPERTGTSSDLYAAAYSGTIYVAVGYSGTIIKSKDGSAWSAPTNYIATPNNLNAITWANGLFVAVGQNGWVATSPDGNNWTSTSSGATVANLNGIAYGDARFVAVADNGVIIGSTNGVNWKTSASGTTDSLEAIAFANGTFVAVSSDNSTVISTDGTHWSAGGNGLLNPIQGVAAANGIFVAVNYYGNTYTSPDGVNWVQQANTDIELTGIAYGGGVFAASGINGAIFVSPNGTNWTQLQASATDQNLYGLVSGNGQFIAVGASGTALAASESALAALPPDTTWNPINSAASYNLNAVAYNGRDYVIVADDPSSDMVSSNSLIWTVEGKGLPGTVEGVTWGSNTFVAVDYYGNVYTSPRGTNWTTQAATGVEMYAVAYGGGIYLATAVSGEVFTSTDDVHWSPHTTGLKGDVDALIYTNSQFVVVADNGKLATSPDGASWTLPKTANTSSLYGIAYGNGLYVAVGGAGTILTSPDASHWTLQTNSPISANDLDAIAWGNGQFMAVGTGGWTVRSADGSNWISSSSATVNNLTSVIFANGSFLAAGDNGAIIETPLLTPSQMLSVVFLPNRVAQVTMLGTPGVGYTIQVLTDLINWTPLTTVTLTSNSGQFIDSATALGTQPHRFYRAIVGP